MASKYDVKFVVRDRSLPKFNSITHIGGELSSGDSWQISVKEAIEGIRSGRFPSPLRARLTNPSNSWFKIIRSMALFSSQSSTDATQSR